MNRGDLSCQRTFVGEECVMSPKMSLLEDGTATVEEGLPSFDVTLFMCDMRKMYP